MSPLEDLLNDKESQYTLIKRRKSNGKIRRIYAPGQLLKRHQTKLARKIGNYYLPLLSKCNYITGFMPKKSISDNAKSHLNKEWVLNFDLTDFFGTIKKKQIMDIFHKANIPEAEKNYQLATLHDKLVQGSPASPIISNCIGYEIIDPAMIKLAEEYLMSYTRYVDNLTFSTDEKFRREQLVEFQEKAYLEIKKIGFNFNPKKTKLKHRSQRQEVTGLLVNNEAPRTTKSLRYIAKEIFKKQEKTASDIGVLNYVKQIKSSDNFEGDNNGNLRTPKLKLPTSTEIPQEVSSAGCQVYKTNR